MDSTSSQSYNPCVLLPAMKKVELDHSVLLPAMKKSEFDLFRPRFVANKFATRLRKTPLATTRERNATSSGSASRECYEVFKARMILKFKDRSNVIMLCSHCQVSSEGHEVYNRPKLNLSPLSFCSSCMRNWRHDKTAAGKW